MDITTKTFTTKEHTATASVDVLKGVAVAAVKNQLGLADDAIVSSTASVGTDGSVTVVIVEAVADAPAAVPAKTADDASTPPAQLAAQVATLTF